MRYFVAPIILSLLLPTSVFAKTKVDIYHAEVPLTQEKNSRSIAWSQGLEQVLIKASGDVNITNNPVIQKAARDGSDYLAKFTYGKLDGQQSLDMQYNPKQIHALLQQAKVSFWPAERENLLVWLVQDDNVNREIGWEQSGLDSVHDLQVSAQQAGLPITLPLGDMDDLTKISATDLWGSFAEPLQQASVRYPVDAVLVLKLTQNGDASEVNWQLYDGVPQQIEQNPQPTLNGTESASSELALSQAIQKVSAYYANKNKPDTQSKTVDDDLLANFSGIKSASAFFDLERRLNSLDSVATVQVRSIQADSVTFEVQLLTTEEAFKQQVTQQKGISSVAAPIQPALAPQAETTADSEQGQPQSETASSPQKTESQAASTEKSLWFGLAP
ncbi:DUF2066 domain-containing protein [Vibrio aphrogenes]|uniref:DUF2066 domain-containing protein n=1 Tax=Vibrio aphrogenes TaxID=1891186 RepID=UPI000B362F8E|nr:DUF2066 domain-containing protein [Vibrio aphrogenes]